MVFKQYEVETDRDSGIPELVVVREFEAGPGIADCNSPESVFQLMKEVYRLDVMAEEWMYMIAVNTRANVLGSFMVAKGTHEEIHVGPREVFCRALLIGASKIFIVHNHPSGSVNPSREDDLITERFVMSGDIIGVTVLDHIIVGKNSYYSYMEDGRVIRGDSAAGGGL